MDLNRYQPAACSLVWLGDCKAEWHSFTATRVGEVALKREGCCSDGDDGERREPEIVFLVCTGQEEIESLDLSYNSREEPVSSIQL